MPEDQQDDFKVWVSNAARGPNQQGLDGVTLKLGRQVCKTVTIGRWGRSPDEISKTELRFRTAQRDPLGGYDFDNAETWFCENDEIPKLQAFLNENLEPGRYRLVGSDSPAAAIASMVESGAVDAGELLHRLSDEAGVDLLARALAQSAAGLSAAEAAVIGERRTLINEVRELIGDPTATERDVQQRIGEEWWLFGGRYVGVADRRNLTALDQFDIPLLGADGTLHIVELKGPSIQRLVVRHRNHFIVGPEVHEAVSQTMNYLRSLDEQGQGLATTYRSELGQEYDMRRVFATVVIGHPDHVRDDVSEAQVDQTIRSYNAHLSRIEVLTYKNLLDSAERALSFEARAYERDEPTPTGDVSDWPWDDDEPF
ncbi:MAG TPA: Shedu anti-phage system protein SduA domain-containing protein [Acidimicrobiales bacterium]|nr:Shedu anti-phage system protein SduA domain-containing protein [Acidimicrobiales bacterium]